MGLLSNMEADLNPQFKHFPIVRQIKIFTKINKNSVHFNGSAFKYEADLNPQLKQYPQVCL